MGTSRSVEAIKIKQSLEAELSRSINHISGVSSARVHLAIPEKTVFAREIALPSASVFVKLVVVVVFFRFSGQNGKNSLET